MLIPDDVYTELRVGPRSVIRSGDKCRIKPRRAYGRYEHGVFAFVSEDKGGEYAQVWTKHGWRYVTTDRVKRG